MKLYRVSDRYIAYLKTIDSRVPDNYSGKRPYVGILLVVDGIQYLAPLTSYKPKQDRMKDKDVTLFKLYETGKEENKLETKIDSLTIDKDGKINENWPKGFFDEYENLLDELLW